MTDEQIANIFTYHAPKGDQTKHYVTIREAAKSLALTINEICPESREKACAITSIQQAVMWANAAKAIHE